MYIANCRVNSTLKDRRWKSLSVKLCMYGWLAISLQWNFPIKSEIRLRGKIRIYEQKKNCEIKEHNLPRSYINPIRMVGWLLYGAVGASERFQTHIIYTYLAAELLKDEQKFHTGSHSTRNVIIISDTTPSIHHLGITRPRCFMTFKQGTMNKNETTLMYTKYCYIEGLKGIFRNFLHPTEILILRICTSLAHRLHPTPYTRHTTRPSLKAKWE